MTMPSEQQGAGKIVTFYSYKGGTGRSMALANVAWALASSGKRVLTIDWDLEAPGLHRYFEPFLADKSLERSTGIIDFVRDFATAAVAVKNTPEQNAEETAQKTSGRDWYEDYSNLLAHAIPLQWDFAGGGLLHLVPAGKQDAAYAVRVNSFDWQGFYERLGGGIFLEAVKQKLRRVYDVILIDSRTGVSDTSGICTIQMPDELVVCFTLNRQSIYGITAAAQSASSQRRTASGQPTLKIWPVPTRVEVFEKDRLEIASTMARARFSGLLWQLTPEQEDIYWGEIAISYEPYYAYEEVLAAFRDRPRQTGSMLARMEVIAAYLNGGPLDRKETIDEVKKAEGLAAFTTHSASDYEPELSWLADEYESIRKRMRGGGIRTQLMDALVGRAQILASQRGAGAVAEKLFSRGTDGGRVIGLALARIDPRRQHIDLALSGIQEARSPFEQFYALLLADKLSPSLHPTAAALLLEALKAQFNKTIPESDSSRWTVAKRLIGELGMTSDLDTQTKPVTLEYELRGKTQVMAKIVTSARARYEDVDETHGPWVKTRGVHALRLPRTIRIGQYPVTNSVYQNFVQAGGYNNDEFWTASRAVRKRFVTLDGQSMGPAIWPSSETLPEGKENHPVTSLSYLEAQAFVKWCNGSLGEEAPDHWVLPLEDHWEFAARSEQGFIYPWGDAFDSTKCNSSEGGIGDTTDVARFAAGASLAGCCDMAGNVWEFVLTADSDSGSCVLRGGSFKNDRFLVRSYLRLSGVPLTHRALDFGFRLALVERSAGKQTMAVA